MLAAFAAGIAVAQPMTGAIRTDFYQSSRTFDNSQGFLGVTFQAEALPKFSDRVDGKISLRAGASGPERNGASRSDFIEAYATVHSDRADLRIGKQIVPWGRADGINPTDNLTPRDYAVQLPLEEDQRFGVFGAKLDVMLTAHGTLSVFAAPRFVPARLPWPQDANPPQDRPTHAVQTGVRYNVVDEGLDWSVSYFRGNAHIPGLQPSGVLTYDRIRVLGADVARNFGRFGVRAEAAYTQTDDSDGRDPFTRNPQLYWVAGVDRTFFDNLNINLQLFRRTVFAYRTLPTAPPEAAAAALQSAILFGQRDRINNGFTFRVSDKWFNDTLGAEVLCIANTTRHDFYLRPLVTYAFTDDWKGMVGAEYFSGRYDTQFGSQKANRGVFAEVRRSF